jgi:hypothetical protein
MELVPAARRHLLLPSALTGYVQDRVYKHKLVEHVDQKGTRAAVVRTNGGWAQASRANSTEYPILAIDCWADCTRDAQGDKAAEDAIDNAWAVYRATDLLIHGVKGVPWADLIVIDAARWSEPTCQTKDEAHGGVGALPYKVELGESAVVTVQYAMTISHSRGIG